MPSPAEPLRLAFLGDPNSVHTRRWVTFFAERGHRVHLLVADDQPLEPGLHPAIHVERYRSYGARLRPRGALRARRSLRRVLARARPDLLHAHYLTRFGWLALLSGFRPLVVTVWGSDILLTPRRSAPAGLLARLILRRAALVTGVSANLLAAARELGAAADRLRVVQFGIDPAVFAPGPASEALRQQLGLEGRRVVFAPRAVAPLYRPGIVVEALADLPEDVAGVFVERGADSATLARLRVAIERRGLAGRVRFVGDLDEAAMAELFRLADVVVSIPESDAFPATALEAMACGRPLVLSDLPAAREGLAGLADPAFVATMLVPVGDAAATRRAIMTALERPSAVAVELAGRLRTLALERADRTRNLGGMEEAYLEIARAGAGRRSGRTSRWIA